MSKIIGQVKPATWKELKQTPQAVREQAYQSLKQSQSQAAPKPEPAAPAPAMAVYPQPQARKYVLDPNNKYTPKAKTALVATQ